MVVSCRSASPTSARHLALTLSPAELESNKEQVPHMAAGLSVYCCIKIEQPKPQSSACIQDTTAVSYSVACAVAKLHGA